MEHQSRQTQFGIEGGKIMMLERQPRQPFRSLEIPLLALWYEAAYGNSGRTRLRKLACFVSRLTFRLFRKWIGAGSAGRFSCDLPQGAVALEFDAKNTQFHSVYLRKFAKGYEPETSVLLDAFLGNSRVFWDVGSNWGHFSLYACSNCSFDGEVYAFEPVPGTFVDLSCIVKQAGLEARIHCQSFALGEKESTATVTLPDGVHSGMARLDAAGGGEGVPIRAADSLGIPDPDIIKLDVEGYEANMLRGAKEVLTRAKPVLIMESWLVNPEETLEPLQLLENCGYQLFHPVWMFECPLGRFYSRSHLMVPAHTRKGLALLPFKSAERGLFGEYINLFACHEQRIPELGKLFANAS